MYLYTLALMDHSLFKCQGMGAAKTCVGGGGGRNFMQLVGGGGGKGHP